MAPWILVHPMPSWAAMYFRARLFRQGLSVRDLPVINRGKPLLPLDRRGTLERLEGQRSAVSASIEDTRKVATSDARDLGDLRFDGVAVVDGRRGTLAEGELSC